MRVCNTSLIHRFLLCEKNQKLFFLIEKFALSDFHSNAIELLPLFRWKLTKIDKFLWGFWIFRKFVQLWRAVSPSSMNIFWWDRYHCKDLCLNFTTRLIRAKTGTWRKSYARWKAEDFRKNAKKSLSIPINRSDTSLVNIFEVCPMT